MELVAHGVLPDPSVLDRIDGACSVDLPPVRFVEPVGPTTSGAFYSAARRQEIPSMAYLSRHLAPG